MFTTVGEAQQTGAGSKQAGETRKGALILTLAPRDERDRQVAIENLVRGRLVEVPGARFSMGSGDIGEKMQLILASDNTAALKAGAQALERQLRGIPGLANVRSTASLERPEIVVRPDMVRAAERGVTTAAIGETVRIATSGDFDPLVARLNLDNRQIYIRVRMADSARRDIDAIGNLRLTGRDGLVPLSSLATVSI